MGWLGQYLRDAHAVYTERGNFSKKPIVSQDVIFVLVVEHGIGGEDERLPIMPGDALSVGVKAEILEGNFLFCLDSAEDSVYHIIDIFIFRLDTANCVQVTV